MTSELLVPPTFGRRCALCWEAFRLGDVYKSVWPRGAYRGGVELGISVHPACFAQLAPGDLGRIFGALRRRLALPIAVLNGRRIVLDSPFRPELAREPHGMESREPRTGSER